MSLSHLGIDTVQELINWKPPLQRYVIEEGILTAGTGMIIFGEAGSWKSILALQLADCIATGSDWFGYKTVKSITFKYQAELTKVVERERVMKYMNSHRPSGVLLKTVPYTALDTSYGKAALERDLQAVKTTYAGQHIVLIIDPVYLFIEGHVSDEYDVKKFLHGTLNDLRSKYSMSVVLIHHPHKTRVDQAGAAVDYGSEEIMGSSYFKDWADTIIQLKLLNPKGSKDRVRFSFSKVRHATKALPDFSVKWSRENLRPTVYDVKVPVDNDEEPTVRDLI